MSIKHKVVFCALLAMANTVSSSAFAATSTTPVEAPTVNPSNRPDQVATKPKLMDGIKLEAVETYVNPRINEISVGLGMYPFDSYYYGLNVSAGYTYHVSRTAAWEIINATYFYSFEKSLRTELADRFNVNPQDSAFNTINYSANSNYIYTFAYGKFTMLEEYIRYFRASTISGIGIVKTDQYSSFDMNVGLKFQVFTRDSFSWNFEARDMFAFTGTNNFLNFILGTSFSF